MIKSVIYVCCLVCFPVALLMGLGIISESKIGMIVIINQGWILFLVLRGMK